MKAVFMFTSSDRNNYNWMDKYICKNMRKEPGENIQFLIIQNLRKQKKR